MRVRRRAFLLIMALLACVIMVILGLGFLSKRSLQYAAAANMETACQALALAQSGLDDARVKLTKDQTFPPQGDQEDGLFTYSEDVFSLDGSTAVGYYTVTVDHRRVREYPEYLVVVTSEGGVGRRLDPIARRRVRAAFQERHFAPAVRPPLRLVRYEDLGSP